jgi:hypothetical protein
MKKLFAKFKSKLKKPTPKKWRKIGNICLLASVSLSSYEVFDGHPFWSVAIAVFGVAGKIITSLVTED